MVLIVMASVRVRALPTDYETKRHRDSAGVVENNHSNASHFL
jgi:hypothetical protein